MVLLCLRGIIEALINSSYIALLYSTVLLLLWWLPSRALLVGRVATMAGKPRVELSLKEKVDILVAAETGADTSHRKLAAQFSVGKTQIANILKRKREILDTYRLVRSVVRTSHQWMM